MAMCSINIVSRTKQKNRDLLWSSFVILQSAVDLLSSHTVHVAIDSFVVIEQLVTNAGFVPAK
jgi:hypothetical protein